LLNSLSKETLENEEKRVENCGCLGADARPTK